MRFDVIVALMMLSRFSLGSLVQENVDKYTTPPYFHGMSQTGINWEFESGFDGWRPVTDKGSPNSTSEIHHKGSWITLHFQGSSPYLESPRLNLYYSQNNFRVDEHTIRDAQGWKLAVRYRYLGSSRNGLILTLSTVEQNDNDAKIYSPFSNSEVDNIADKNCERLYYFTIAGDGLWHTVYINLTCDPIFLKHIRIYPDSSSFTIMKETNVSSISIDWIRLVRAPVLKRITGCSANQYSSDPLFQNDISDDIFASMVKANESQHSSTNLTRHNLNELPFARTFNCNRSGGDNVTIEGLRLGFGTQVYIDGFPCKKVRHNPNYPEKLLTCITPKYTQRNNMDSMVEVEVRNGIMSGLSDVRRFLRYANPPPAPVDVHLSNISARSIDVSWRPGGAFNIHLTYTGYIIKWRSYKFNLDQMMVVGNVTKTTVRGLHHDTIYCFSISGLTENQKNDSWWADLDEYGRRLHDGIIPGALEGQASRQECGRTRLVDIEFNFFDSTDVKNSIGSAVSSAEGFNGLILVGDANIENCDEYCYGSSQSKIYRKPLIHKYTQSTETSSGSVIQTFGRVSQSFPSNYQCTPALRLTSAYPNQRGAIWYRRQLEIFEGFETNFTFRISNPSTRCRNLQGIFDYCRSRGGDGLAFVIQSDGDEVIGGYGNHLGYGGINNSLTVEFDSYYNDEDEYEPYENHISVFTGGKRQPSHSKHRFTLGDSAVVPEMTSGEVRIRIKYEPFLDESQLLKQSFTITNHLTDFFMYEKNNSFSQSEYIKSRKGPGTLSIYCQDLHEPVLIIPLDISMALDLHRGRAWVGFTAATGNNSWQVHDILNWTFTSLRLDTVYH